MDIDTKATTTWTSAKIAGRTAEVTAENTVTIFQGPKTIAIVQLSATATPGDIWNAVHSAEAPVTEPTPVLQVEAPVKKEQGEYPEWFSYLLNEGRGMSRTKFEQTAYKGYVAYALSMTDGHYAPETFERWVISFRKNPVQELFYGNEKRADLAPYASKYVKGLGQARYAGLSKLLP